MEDVGSDPTIGPRIFIRDRPSLESFDRVKTKGLIRGVSWESPTSLYNSPTQPPTHPFVSSWRLENSKRRISSSEKRQP